MIHSVCAFCQTHANLSTLPVECPKYFDFSQIQYFNSPMFKFLSWGLLAICIPIIHLTFSVKRS